MLIPSSVTLLYDDRVPLITMSSALLLTPACVEISAIGSRSSMGSRRTCSLVTVVEISAFEVCTVCTSAVTSTAWRDGGQLELNRRQRRFARRVDFHAAQSILEESLGFHNQIVGDRPNTGEAEQPFRRGDGGQHRLSSRREATDLRLRSGIAAPDESVTDPVSRPVT